MKRRLRITASLFFLTFFCTSFISAQDYLITFSGSGQSNTVETVEVKNIAQQTTLTLSGTDTLLLTDVVGTGYLPSLSQGMIIYPNPTQHSSRLEFYNASSGITRIEVYDFSGRLLISKSIQLAAGSHAFTISGLTAGIYLVKVNIPENIYSRRLISTSVLQLAPELHYDGTGQSCKKEPEFKSISNIVAMQYNDGERLVFKALSGDYAHTKSLIPTESQNIDFEFMDCIDGDGNQYGVVTIGEQVWMAENLNIGIMINSSQNQTNNGIIEKYCYNNDPLICINYGGLYQWNEMMGYTTTPGTQGICPTGWHLPSDSEWTQLVDHVVAQGFPNQWANPGGAGNALKSCRQVNSPLGGDCNTTQHPRWNSHSTHHGFDAFGFSGLPGGFRADDGFFSDVGNYGYWWSSTVYSAADAWYRGLYYSGGLVSRYNYYFGKIFGFSVRCLKDNSDQNFIRGTRAY